MVGAIHKAMAESIPQIHISKKSNFIPDNIKNLIKVWNNLRKIFQWTKSQEIKKIKNKLSNIISKKLTKHNNETWNAKLENLKIADNSLWKIAKCLIKRHSSSIPILHGLNGLAFSDEDRVEQLAENYERVHHMPGTLGQDETDHIAEQKCIEINAQQVNMSRKLAPPFCFFKKTKVVLNCTRFVLTCAANNFWKKWKLGLKFWKNDFFTSTAILFFLKK